LRSGCGVLKRLRGVTGLAVGLRRRVLRCESVLRSSWQRRCLHVSRPVPPIAAAIGAVKVSVRPTVETRCKPQLPPQAEASVERSRPAPASRPKTPIDALVRRL
jgi:hypothetical protein